MNIIYFFIAIATTTIGSLTGMGGGVIIKPVLDMIGHFDAGTIGILSSISVFSMSVVAIVKQILAKAEFRLGVVIPLGFGAGFGGITGQIIFDNLVASFENKTFITVIQNFFLGILILVVFLYMINKDKIKSKELTGKVNSFLVGVCLGIISSFLGIGGGPINVAIFIYLFSYDTKMAATSSLIAILFSQISKLASIAFTTGFAEYDLSVLPYMVVGAIMGGFIGSKLTIKFTDKQIEFAFNIAQIFIFILCIVNIIRALSVIA